MPEWGGRIFVTFNSIFSEFLGFCIPLIIIGFVAPSIGEMGSRSGKMLLVTALLAYIATVFAGLFSYIISDAFFPQMIAGEGGVALLGESGTELTPYFTIEINALMPVMTALVTAFIVGFGIAYLQIPVLKSLAEEGRSVVMMIITRVIIPLLPIYIFGIFMDMTICGKVAGVLSAFSKIIIVIFVMHLVLLLMQYSVAAMFSRHGRNPLKLLWKMMPAYFTALGTQSSAATIPVTLRQTKLMGVDANVAGFVIPLCATIHLSGSTLKIVACALALMIIHGYDYDFQMIVGFVMMLGITMIAAPGVPGGAIMAATGVLADILGFSQSDIALMIALYIAMDSFGTACNVTGDGAIAVIVDRIFGGKK